MSSEPQRRLILHMSVSLDGFSAAGRDIPGSVDHGSVRHQANQKGEPGGDIVAFGCPRFAHSLIRHRLVDEYRLAVHPIALGGGSALMHGLPEPQRFELVSSTVYTDGSTVQVLRPGGGDG